MADKFFELRDEFTEDGFLYFFVYQRIDPETSRRYGWFMSIDPEEEFYQHFDGDLSKYEVTNPTIITTSDGLRYERKTWIDTTVTKEMCEKEVADHYFRWKDILTAPPIILHRRF